MRPPAATHLAGEEYEVEGLGPAVPGEGDAPQLVLGAGVGAPPQVARVDPREVARDLAHRDPAHAGQRAPGPPGALEAGPPGEEGAVGAQPHRREAGGPALPNLRWPARRREPERRGGGGPGRQNEHGGGDHGGQGGRGGRDGSRRLGIAPPQPHPNLARAAGFFIGGCIAPGPRRGAPPERAHLKGRPLKRSVARTLRAFIPDCVRKRRTRAS